MNGIIFGSGNGLSSIRRQTIHLPTFTNTDFFQMDSNMMSYGMICGTHCLLSCYSFCCFQGNTHFDMFFKAVGGKLRTWPYVLFVALGKTNQDSVLHETESCWR